MDKQLRIIAGVIVAESKLSKEAKLQLLNFIQKEATDTQVKALLLDGKILTKIDEQTEELINARFVLKEDEYRDLESKGKKVAMYGISAILGGLLGAGLMAAYRHFTDKCVNQCSHDPNKNKCKNLCNAKGCDQPIAKLKAGLGRIRSFKTFDASDESKKQKAMQKVQNQIQSWERKKQSYLLKAKSGY